MTRCITSAINMFGVLNVLHVFNESATYVVHLYFYTCTIQLHYTCNTLNIYTNTHVLHMYVTCK